MTTGYECACVQVNICDEKGIISTSQWFISKHVANEMKTILKDHLGFDPTEAMIDGLRIVEECNTIANNSVIIEPDSK